MPPVTVLLKFTVNGALHDPVLSALKVITGLAKTFTVFEIESAQAPKPATILIVNVPVVLYVLAGLLTVDVVPSPKYQVTFAGIGVLVFVKLKGVPSQIIAGAVKSAFTLPTVMAFVLIIVSVHPVGLTIISLMV